MVSSEHVLPPHTLEKTENSGTYRKTGVDELLQEIDDQKSSEEIAEHGSSPKRPKKGNGNTNVRVSHPSNTHHLLINDYLEEIRRAHDDFSQSMRLYTEFKSNNLIDDFYIEFGTPFTSYGELIDRILRDLNEINQALSAFKVWDDKLYTIAEKNQCYELTQESLEHFQSYYTLFGQARRYLSKDFPERKSIAQLFHRLNGQVILGGKIVD